MSYNRDVVILKLNEISCLLKESGYNSNIEVHISDSNGNVDKRIYLDGGYWKNSTAVCSMYDEDIDVDVVTASHVHDESTWQSSGLC